MSEKLYEALKNIREEDVDYFLENTVKKCFVDSYFENCSSLVDYSHGFGVNENGEFYHCITPKGYLTFKEMKGIDFYLGRISAINSYYDDYCNKGTIIDIELLDSLQEEEQEYLIEELLLNEDIQVLDDKAREEDIGFDIFYCYDNYSDLVEQAFKKLYPEIIEEKIKKDLEGCCWNKEKELLKDQFLVFIKEGIMCYEEDEEDWL